MTIEPLLKFHSTHFTPPKVSLDCVICPSLPQPRPVPPFFCHSRRHEDFAPAQTGSAMLPPSPAARRLRIFRSPENLNAHNGVLPSLRSRCDRKPPAQAAFESA